MGTTRLEKTWTCLYNVSRDVMRQSSLRARRGPIPSSRPRKEAAVPGMRFKKMPPLKHMKVKRALVIQFATQWTISSPWDSPGRARMLWRHFTLLPGDHPNTRIVQVSTLQADSFPSEPPRKPSPEVYFSVNHNLSMWRE